MVSAILLNTKKLNHDTSYDSSLLNVQEISCFLSSLRKQPYCFAKWRKSQSERALIT